MCIDHEEFYGMSDAREGCGKSNTLVENYVSLFLFIPMNTSGPIWYFHI
jgi:hypothetical protein